MHPDHARAPSRRTACNRRAAALLTPSPFTPTVIATETMSAESPHNALAADAGAPDFDWREWLSFAGSVLGTALVVSVVLAGVVLLLA